MSAEAVVLSQKTDVPQVLVLPLDPLNGPTAMVLPFVAKRIFDMASERMGELDPERLVRGVLARVFAGDRSILVLVFLDPTGKPVGHLVAEACSDGVKKWAFVSQTKADGNVGDAVRRAMLLVDEWAGSLTDLAPHGVPVTTMTMATHRDDAAWSRKYGLEKSRAVYTRAIGSPVGQSQ